MAAAEQKFPCERCSQDMGYHGYLLAVDGVCGPCCRKEAGRLQVRRQAAEKATFQGR